MAITIASDTPVGRSPQTARKRRTTLSAAPLSVSAMLMIVAIAITIATPPAVRPSPSAVSSTARTSWPLSGCRGSGGSPSAMPPARSAAVTRARKGWSLSTSTPTITVAMQARMTTNGQVSATATARIVPCMDRVVGVARAYWQPPLAPGSLAGPSPRACALGLLWRRRLEVAHVVVPGGRSGQPGGSQSPGLRPGASMAAEAVLAGSPGMAVAAASPVHVYDRRGGKAVEVRAARR